MLYEAIIQLLDKLLEIDFAMKDVAWASGIYKTRFMSGAMITIVEHQPLNFVASFQILVVIEGSRNRV